MDEVQEEMLTNWMSSLYQIALINIGEDRMLCESWYYTNKEVWKYYMIRGYSPLEAYLSDVENCA